MKNLELIWDDVGADEYAVLYNDGVGDTHYLVKRGPASEFPGFRLIVNNAEPGTRWLGVRSINTNGQSEKQSEIEWKSIVVTADPVIPPPIPEPEQPKKPTAQLFMTEEVGEIDLRDVVGNTLGPIPVFSDDPEIIAATGGIIIAEKGIFFHRDTTTYPKSATVRLEHVIGFTVTHMYPGGLYDYTPKDVTGLVGFDVIVEDSGQEVDRFTYSRNLHKGATR